MINFRMNMPFYLMGFSGSIMILLISLLRIILKKRLPKFVFPILWFVVLLRLLIPFSISTPISLKLPNWASSVSNTAITDAIETTASNTEFYAAYGDISEEPDHFNSVTDTTLPGTGITEETAENNTAVTEQTAYMPGSENSGTFQVDKLIALYWAGFIITLVILLWQKHRCDIMLKDSLPVENNDLINSVLSEMNIKNVRVFTCDGLVSPMARGLFKASIYLPAHMNFENTVMLRHIITHEVMHIKHGDNRLKALMLAALILNWFNPLVWLLSRFLNSDLEAACDEAVLDYYDNDDERKAYALSLLEMAVSRNRPALFYSAFSKTEVEKRIKNILNYKKATALALAVATAFLLCSASVFAATWQAPFSPYLSSFCLSSNCRWGVSVELTRDAALGNNAKERAENIIMSVLKNDVSGRSDVIKAQIKTALSAEFNVEENVFDVKTSLCLDDTERNEEYEKWGLTQADDGFFVYKDKPIKTLSDKTLGLYQTKAGVVDITIERDTQGYIVNLMADYEY